MASVTVNETTAVRTEIEERRPLSGGQLWNMNFGMLGIQFGWALQMTNMSAIYLKLHADADKIPILAIAGPGHRTSDSADYRGDERPHVEPAVRTPPPLLHDRRDHCVAGAVRDAVVAGDLGCRHLAVANGRCREHQPGAVPRVCSGQAADLAALGRGF